MSKKVHSGNNRQYPSHIGPGNHESHGGTGASVAKRSVKPRTRDTYTNERYGIVDESVDAAAEEDQVLAKQPERRHNNEKPVARRSSRRVKSRSLDTYTNERYGIEDDAPCVLTDTPAKPHYPLDDEDRELIGAIHENRLGALRCAKAMISFGRAAGDKLAQVQAQFGEEAFENWTRPTLGLPANEALGWMRFANEPQAGGVDVSPTVAVEPEVVLRLIGLLHRCFQPADTKS